MSFLSQARISRTMKFGASLALILLLCMPAWGGGSGPIKVLDMGATATWLSPVPLWGKVEPMLDITFIPSTIPIQGMATPDLEPGRRAMRLYFPRTYEQLIEQDYMIYEHMFMEFFTPAQMDQMYRAIRDDGVGGFVTIGGVTHTSVAPNYAWINSRLNDAFPSLASEEIFVLWKQYGTKRAKVKINEDPTLAPVLKMFIPLGMDNIVQPLVYFMAAKEGAKIWAWSDDGLDKPPFLISWTYGKGETWSNTLGMGYAWWRLDQPSQGGNPFALDVFMNMLFYSTGRELPNDILKVHTVRQGLINYEEAKSWVLSVVDFADRFGANTGKLYNEIAAADDIRAEARTVYVQQEYDQALSLVEDARDYLDGIAEHALRLKDRALMWTYLIEWLAVLATMILSGQVVYALMIRRRLYRGVTSTRSV